MLEISIWGIGIEQGHSPLPDILTVRFNSNKYLPVMQLFHFLAQNVPVRIFTTKPYTTNQIF